MATVQEIAARIASERPGDQSRAPDTTESFEAVPGGQHRQESGPVSKRPTRKIWATIITGVVASASAYASEKFGIELDAALTAAVTGLLISAAGYITRDKTL